MHIKSIHDQIYSHICDLCGRKFKFKQPFEQHVAEHQGIYKKPEQCSICGEWVRKLKMHMKRRHPVEKPDPVCCSICGSWHETKEGLQSHIRYTHNTKNTLQCSFCDKTFKYQRNWEVSDLITEHSTSICINRSFFFPSINRNTLPHILVINCMNVNFANKNFVLRPTCMHMSSESIQKTGRKIVLSVQRD